MFWFFIIHYTDTCTHFALIFFLVVNLMSGCSRSENSEWDMMMVNLLKNNWAAFVIFWSGHQSSWIERGLLLWCHNRNKMHLPDKPLKFSFGKHSNISHLLHKYKLYPSHFRRRIKQTDRGEEKECYKIGRYLSSLSVQKTQYLF